MHERLVVVEACYDVSMKSAGIRRRRSRNVNSRALRCRSGQDTVTRRSKLTGQMRLSLLVRRAELCLAKVRVQSKALLLVLEINLEVDSGSHVTASLVVRRSLEIEPQFTTLSLIRTQGKSDMCVAFAAV